MNLMNFRRFARTILAAISVGVLSAAAFATPSSHIWTPSVDIQPFRTGHVTTDVYIPVDKPVSTRPGTITNLGLTFGVHQSKKIAAEFGFDHIEGTYPIYLNAKIAVSENAYGEGSPALAVGVYNVGLNRDGEARTGQVAKTGTDYDVYYAKAARTYPEIGRLSAGYYIGNKKLLVDQNGKADEKGVLLTWEKTLERISENFSVNVDYMGGQSNFGVLSYGFSWKFAPNVSVTCAYVDQTNERINPGNTFAVEVDIDFDLPKMKGR